MVRNVSWHPYQESADSTVVGDVRVSDPLAVEYLDVERELLVYLPPSYTETDRRYPVVYMQDGQNVFDAATSNDGEWEVDETMERLAAETGLEAVVVAVPNAGELRPVEYSPFFDESALLTDDDDPHPYEGVEPRGEAYAEFLVETVVPLIDEQFRTSDDRTEIGVVGSSMGGLISLYSFFRDPEMFGFVGAMSPAAGGPWHEIYEYIEDTGHVEGRIYVDMGGEEFADNPERAERFVSGAEELVERLEAMGYDERLRYVFETDAIHHEDAWRRRFPEAIQFLLG